MLCWLHTLQPLTGHGVAAGRDCHCQWGDNTYFRYGARLFMRQECFFRVDEGKMCKWHEFASSDPMQPMQCSARLQSSRESPLGQQENETSSVSFGGHTGFCASMDIRATTASCTTQPQFLPLLLKPLQKSQWETLLGCDRS